MALASSVLVNRSGAVVAQPQPQERTVLLFFGAGWCPDCQAVFPQLRAFHETHRADGLEVVYVSSDASAEAMLHELQNNHGDWLAVSFDDARRQELKRETKTCAKKEMAEVGLEERERGIPTVALLNRRGEVATFDALNDILQRPDSAMEIWAKLLSE